MGKISIICIDCGKGCSFDGGIGLCPHCQSDYPEGIICNIYGIQTRESEGEWKIGNKYNKSDPRLFFHKSCRIIVEKEFLSVSAVNVLCSTCKKSNLIQMGGFNSCIGVNVKCRFCENTLHYLDECTACSLPLVKINSVRTNVLPKYSGIIGEDANRYTHKYCYKKYPLRVGSRCFVVTACYGKDSPQVETLRNFRDAILLNNFFGKISICIYENLSPPLAKGIAKNNFFRFIAKKTVVNPIYWIVKKVYKY